MKLFRAHVTNFGSYKELDFNFHGLGLTLVYGATGSGKSSLLDVAPWVLFGLTAKGGKVDDVRSWQAQDEPTAGSLEVKVGETDLVVYRARGSSSQNDLYYVDTSNIILGRIRGKDIKDTQRLLNERLGVTPDLYLASAYASEFSPTARFFTDTAKRQREIFDLVADLSFPITLAERASDVRKEAKKELEETERSYAKAAGRLEELLRSKDLAVKQAASWEEGKARAIKELEARAENFETEKAEKLTSLRITSEIWALDKSSRQDSLNRQLHNHVIAHPGGEPCPTCGHNPAVTEQARWYKDKRAEKLSVDAMLNPHIARIEDLEFYKPGLDYMIKTKKEEINPHCTTLERTNAELEDCEDAADAYVELKGTLEAKISSLTQLIDLSSTMRGTLLTRTVSEIQTETNRILETYFDGEIRVDFCLKDDDLQVGITKNGYEATYAQLSKGQRQLLKLSFMVSVMKSAANNGGVSFAQRFFDESLDGLDSELKVKAYGLFQELSKESGVMVIEHSTELREMFDSRIHVSLNGDNSELDYE